MIKKPALLLALFAVCMGDAIAHANFNLDNPSESGLYGQSSETSVAPDTIRACDSYTWYGTRYTESGVYVHHTQQGGSNDTVHTLYLTIYESQHNAVVSSSCDTLMWHDRLYTSSGTYVYHYEDEYGCAATDTLHLTVLHSTHNAFDTTVCDQIMWHNRRYTANGTYTYNYFNDSRCFSTDTLHLTVATGVYNFIDTAVCNSMQWRGFTLNSTGIHVCPYLSADGCNSADTVQLTVNTGTFEAESDTVCDSLTWHGTAYTATGMFVWPYVNGTGCASADTLHLTVNHGTFTTFDTMVCGGMWWHGIGRTSAGRNTYVYDYTNADGCASADTLHLTVYIDHHTIVRTVCDSIRWHDTLRTETGVYVAHLFPTGEFCLNNDTLRLTVNHSAHQLETVTVCEQYSWHGNTYTETGDVIYRYADSNNCPASDTLRLTVNYGTHDRYDTVSCSALNWNGRRYAATGLYMYSYINTYGCSSVDTINLTRLPDLHTTLDTAVCDSLVWKGQLYTSANLYTDRYIDTNGCPTVDTLRLDVDYSYNTSLSDTVCDYYTWHNTVYDSTGVYTHVSSMYNACHNTDTLRLTVYPSSHLSVTRTVCNSYTWNGMSFSTSCDTVYHGLTEHDCEVADTLHLTVNYSKATVDTVRGCDSYVWIDGVTYYDNNNTETYTLQTVNHCDSVVTINLTLGHRNTGVDSASWCDTYVWRGMTGSSDTTVLDTLVNMEQCDSVVSRRFIIKRSTPGHVNVLSCYSYRWVDGVTYVADTVVTTTLTNSVGCDSVLTMDLTITPLYTVSFNANGGTGSMQQAALCAGEELVLPRNSFSRQGYLFAGWTIGATLDSMYYHDRDTLTVTADMTLYALWRSNCNDVEGTLTVNACDSYTWQGTVYYADTTVLDTLRGAVPGGCDSICTLILTVRSSSEGVDFRRECDRLTWIDGYTYTSSVDASTHAVVYALTNVAGCDSIVSLHLDMHYSAETEIDTAACDSLLWYDGTMHYASALDETLLSTFYGCDSTVTHRLTIYPSYDDTVAAAICDGQSYNFGGMDLNVPGMYGMRLTSEHGCDSLVVVDLRVGTNTDTVIVAVVCDTFLWNDSTYTVSTVDTAVIANSWNCDSTMVLQLTIAGYTTEQDVEKTVCDSVVWYDGTVFTESVDTTAYLFTIGGCDSVVNYSFTINRSYSLDSAVTACGTYPWRGTTLHPAATPYELQSTGFTTQGCDSTVTLSVMVYDTYLFEYWDTICKNQSRIFNGTTYTQTGSYVVPLHTVAGCDSLLALHLMVLTRVDYTQVLRACDSLTWDNGITYRDDATASRFVENPNGCDSIYHLELHVSHAYEGSYDTTIVDTMGGFYWQGLYCDHTGDYTYILHTVDGCDSTLILHLTVISTQDSNIGIRMPDGEIDFTLYPNPTQGRIALQGNATIEAVEVYDLKGRRLMRYEGNKRELDITSLPSGTYVLRLFTGNSAVVRRVVKQ